MNFKELVKQVGFNLAVCILEKKFPADFWDNLPTDQKVDILLTAMEIKEGSAGFIAFMRLGDIADWKWWLTASLRPSAPDYFVDAAHSRIVEKAKTLDDWRQILRLSKDESLCLIAALHISKLATTPKKMVLNIYLIYSLFLWEKLSGQRLPLSPNVEKDVVIGPYIKIAMAMWHQLLSQIVYKEDWYDLYRNLEEDDSPFGAAMLEKSKTAPSKLPIRTSRKRVFARK